MSLTCKNRFTRALALLLCLLAISAKPATRPSTQTIEARNEDTAHRIVYVMDFSGSMVQKAAATRSWVNSEVDKLDADARFNVVLSQGRNCKAFKPAVCEASAANKEGLRDFLNEATTEGTDDLVSALRIAKKFDASIVLITDGDVGNPKSIAEFLRTIPTQHEVKIELFDYANVSAKLVKEIHDKTGRNVDIVNHPKPG